MTCKRITNAEFRRALQLHREQDHSPLPIASRPASQPAVMKVGVDMRLTTEDLAKLTPEQAQAVFEGVGHLAGAGLIR